MSVPIVMVTGKGDVIDRVVGLELGADDYITKPFHVREVLARVRTVLRRSQAMQTLPVDGDTAADKSKAAFDGFKIDFKKRELRNNSDNLIPLTSGEFQLLEVFIRHPHQVLSRDQIMDHLKGYDWSPLDRSIDNQIARLRKKIATGVGQQSLIITIRGAGYRFTADVKK